MSVTSNAVRHFLRINCLVALTLIATPRPAVAEDTNTAPAAAATSPAAMDAERSFLQFQEAIERNRIEVQAIASNTMDLGEHLLVMENSLVNERNVQLRSIEHSNNMILIAAAGVAGIGILALALGAFLQWTAVNRLAATVSGLSPGHAPELLGMGESHSLDQSNARFLSLVDRLERRLNELEAPVKPPWTLTLGASEEPKTNGAEKPAAAASDKAGLVNVLFSKSQTLLKLDKPEAALACLDELLALDPGNVHALIRKGAALERLDRLDEAIECYDRAIAQDKSMIMAYLRKGGIFNRMERYTEALACYEQALKKPEAAAAAPTV
jgi:tetratricopeptide (TPR) repeat protein